MKKIVILTVLILVLICTVFSTVTNAGEKLIKWKMSTYFPPNYLVVEVDKHFVKLIHQIAGDKLQIKWYPAKSIVPSKQLFEAVRTGILNMAGEYAGYWAGKDTAFNLLGSYPLGLTGPDYMNWVYQGGGFDLYQEVYGKFGIFYLPTGILPMESGIRGNKPIKSLADFKGLKVRISGKAAGKVLKDIGGSQVNISSSEVYQALQKGVIDGAESCTPIMDWGLGYGQVTKYWCAPGWHQPGSVQGCMFNKKDWDGLSEDLKTKLKIAAMANSMWGYTFHDYSSIEGTKKFLDKGIKVTRLEREDMRKLHKIINKHTLESAKRNPLFAKVAYSQYKYLKDISDWRKIGKPYHYGPDLDEIPDLDAIKACIK